MTKSITNALRKMNFSAVFLNNIDLFFCELSYMSELKALMQKSADSEAINSKL